jgi:hypothetical protein
MTPATILQLPSASAVAPGRNETQLEHIFVPFAFV